MKSLIVCISVHHGNTQKVAEAMSEVLGAEVLEPGETNPAELSKYDLVGFGSGIFLHKHHKSLLDFADKMQTAGRKAFVFSTSGGSSEKSHKTLNGKLRGKDFEILGEFHCRGWDTAVPFNIFGGLNKGKPNERDLEDAREFARSLMKRQSFIKNKR